MGAKFKNYLAKIMAVAVLAAMAGCTSTEVVDDLSANNEKGQEISLKIGVPDPSVGTRAGSDHKLRFSALLFEGDMKPSPNLLERKEVIASDGDAAAQIIFQVPEGTYTIVLVGDYIPLDAVANDKGWYADKYYDTSYNNQSIRMRSFRNFDNNNEYITEKCVNNDNYDCFAGSIEVTKGAEKVEKDVTLTRIVSKVRFVSTTPAKDSPLNKVEISSLNFLYDYLPITGVANGQSGILYKGNLYDVDYNPEDNELFYFYSLAPVEGKDGTLNEISFSVTYEDGTHRDITIPAGTINVVQNYITTVKGAFLSEPEQEVGDIVLNLSKSDDWKNNETEVNPQIE